MCVTPKVLKICELKPSSKNSAGKLYKFLISISISREKAQPVNPAQLHTNQS